MRTEARLNSSIPSAEGRTPLAIVAGVVAVDAAPVLAMQFPQPTNRPALLPQFYSRCNVTPNRAKIR
jgi:hypothetical protein